MEDIEYLEEYEDLIFQTIQSNNSEVGGFATNTSSNMMQDEDSSSIDQDIFESLFDDHSDDETNASQNEEFEVDPALRQPGLNDRSLDSLDTLVNDLVGERNCQQNTEEPKTKSNLALLSEFKSSPQLRKKLPTFSKNSHSSPSPTDRAPQKVSSTTSSSTFLKNRPPGSSFTKILDRSSTTCQNHVEIPSGSCEKLATLNASHNDATNKTDKSRSVATVRPTVQKRQRNKHFPQTSTINSNVRQISSSVSNHNPTIRTSTTKGEITQRGGLISGDGVGLVKRSASTISQAEIRIRKDPAEDPLSLDDLSDALLDSEADTFSLSEVTDESLGSLSEIGDSQHLDISNDSSHDDNACRETPSPSVLGLGMLPLTKPKASKAESSGETGMSKSQQTLVLTMSGQYISEEGQVSSIHSSTKKPSNEKVTIISDTLLSRIDTALLDTAVMDKPNPVHKEPNQSDGVVVTSLEREMVPYFEINNSTITTENDVPCAVFEEKLDEVSSTIPDTSNSNDNSTIPFDGLTESVYFIIDDDKIRKEKDNKSEAKISMIKPTNTEVAAQRSQISKSMSNKNVDRLEQKQGYSSDRSASEVINNQTAVSGINKQQQKESIEVTREAEIETFTDSQTDLENFIGFGENLESILATEQINQCDNEDRKVTACVEENATNQIREEEEESRGEKDSMNCREKHVKGTSSTFILHSRRRSDTKAGSSVQFDVSKQTDSTEKNTQNSIEEKTTQIESKSNEFSAEGKVNLKEDVSENSANKNDVPPPRRKSKPNIKDDFQRKSEDKKLLNEESLLKPDYKLEKTEDHTIEDGDKAHKSNEISSHSQNIVNETTPKKQQHEITDGTSESYKKEDQYIQLHKGDKAPSVASSRKETQSTNSGSTIEMKKQENSKKGVRSPKKLQKEFNAESLKTKNAKKAKYNIETYSKDNSMDNSTKISTGKQKLQTSTESKMETNKDLVEKEKKFSGLEQKGNMDPAEIIQNKSEIDKNTSSTILSSSLTASINSSSTSSICSNATQSRRPSINIKFNRVISKCKVYNEEISEELMKELEFEEIGPQKRKNSRKTFPAANVKKNSPTGKQKLYVKLIDPDKVQSKLTSDIEKKEKPKRNISNNSNQNKNKIIDDGIKEQSLEPEGEYEGEIPERNMPSKRADNIKDTNQVLQESDKLDKPQRKKITDDSATHPMNTKNVTENNEGARIPSSNKQNSETVERINEETNLSAKEKLNDDSKSNRSNRSRKCSTVENQSQHKEIQGKFVDSVGDKIEESAEGNTNLKVLNNLTVKHRRGTGELVKVRQQQDTQFPSIINTENLVDKNEKTILTMKPRKKSIEGNEQGKGEVKVAIISEKATTGVQIVEEERQQMTKSKTIASSSNKNIKRNIKRQWSDRYDETIEGDQLGDNAIIQATNDNKSNSEYSVSLKNKSKKAKFGEDKNGNDGSTEIISSGTTKQPDADKVVRTHSTRTAMKSKASINSNDDLIFLKSITSNEEVNQHKKQKMPLRDKRISSISTTIKIDTKVKDEEGKKRKEKATLTTIEKVPNQNQTQQINAKDADEDQQDPQQNISKTKAQKAKKGKLPKLYTSLSFKEWSFKEEEKLSGNDKTNISVFEGDSLSPKEKFYGKQHASSIELLPATKGRRTSSTTNLPTNKTIIRKSSNDLIDLQQNTTTEKGTSLKKSLQSTSANKECKQGILIETIKVTKPNSSGMQKSLERKDTKAHDKIRGSIDKNQKLSNKKARQNLPSKQKLSFGPGDHDDKNSDKRKKSITMDDDEEKRGIPPIEINKSFYELRKLNKNENTPTISANPLQIIASRKRPRSEIEMLMKSLPGVLAETLNSDIQIERTTTVATKRRRRASNTYTTLPTSPTKKVVMERSSPQILQFKTPAIPTASKSALLPLSSSSSSLSPLPIMPSHSYFPETENAKNYESKKEKFQARSKQEKPVREHLQGNNRFRCRKLRVRINRSTVRNYYNSLLIGKRPNTFKNSKSNYKNICQSSAGDSNPVSSIKTVSPINSKQNFREASVTTLEYKTIAAPVGRTATNECTNKKSENVKPIKAKQNDIAIASTKCNEAGVQQDNIGQIQSRSRTPLKGAKSSLKPIKLNIQELVTSGQQQQQQQDKDGSHSQVCRQTATRQIHQQQQRRRRLPNISSRLKQEQKQHLPQENKAFTPIEPKKELDHEQLAKQTEQASPALSSSSDKLSEASTATTVSLLTGGMPVTVVDNSGTRLYTFLHPVKYNNNHGAVLLDYCCPNLEGPIPALDPTREHAQLQSFVREIPAYIVMTTKVITRADLETKNNTIPASIRKKMEKLSSIVLNQRSKSAEIIKLKTAKNASTKLITKAPTPIAAPNIVPTNATSATIPAGGTTLNVLQKQLPSAMTLTTKLPTVRHLSSSSDRLPPLTSHSTISPLSVPSGQLYVETPAKLKNPSQTIEFNQALLRSNLRRFDLVLKKHSFCITKLTYLERQRIIDGVVDKAIYTPKDVEQATNLLEDYCQLFNDNLSLTKSTISTTSKSLTSITNSTTSLPTIPVSISAASVAPLNCSVTSASVNVAQKCPGKVHDSNGGGDGSQNRRQMPIYDKDQNIIGYQMHIGSKKLSVTSAVTPSTNSINSNTPARNTIPRVHLPIANQLTSVTNSIKQPAQESPRIFYTKPITTSPSISNIQSSSSNSMTSLKDKNTSTFPAPPEASYRFAHSTKIQQIAPKTSSNLDNTTTRNSTLSKLLNQPQKKIKFNPVAKVATTAAGTRGGIGPGIVAAAALSSTTSNTVTTRTNVSISSTNAPLTSKRITRHSAAVEAGEVVLITTKDSNIGNNAPNNDECILPDDDSSPAAALKEIKREKEDIFIG